MAEFSPYDQMAFANYTPLSSQDILQPALLMRDRRDKLEEEYAAIDNELQKASFIVQNENDPIIKSKYENYYNSLSNSMNNLMEQGLTPNSRRDALKLRSRFQSEIAPINMGYQMKSQDIQRYNDMIVKDPTYIGQDPTSRTVSDYINNGLQPFAQQGISGALVTKMASDYLSPFSKELTGTELNNLVSDILYKADGSEENIATMREYIKRHGYKPGSEGHKVLMGKARQAIMNSIGVSPWADENQLTQIDSYINMAANQTIGQEQSQFINTEDNLNRRQIQQDKLNAKEYAQRVEDDSLILPTVERGIKKVETILDPSFNDDFERENRFIQSITTLLDGTVSDAETQELEITATKLESEAQAYLEANRDKIDYPEGTPVLNFYTNSTHFQRAQINQGGLGKVRNVGLRLATREQKEYNKLLTRAKELREQVKSNIERNTRLVEQYSHLSSNPADAITLGYMYDNARRVRTDNAFVLNPSTQSIMKDNILNWSETDPNSGLYKINDDGSIDDDSPMSVDDIRELKKNEDRVTIEPLLSTNGVELQVGNERYAVKTNRSDVIQANNVMTRGSSYLTDFSTPSKETSASDSAMTVEAILKSPNAQLIERNKSFELIGETFRMPDGDLQKVLLIKPAGKQWRVLTSSLYDEIQGGSLSSKSINLLGGLVATGFSNTNVPNKNNSSSYTEKNPQQFPTN